MLTLKQIDNRRQGIGASESAIVMGLSNFMSPYELWLIKTGRNKQEDISSLPQVHWGNVHENTIAQEYARQTNQKVRRVTNTLISKDHHFMLCHLDRKIEGKPKVLECKFAMYSSDNWGLSGSDIVPLSYIIQVQHQLAVTGYQEADLAVLISGFDFRIYNFKRDEEIINKIIEYVAIFWHCVETDTPPALRDRYDAALAHPTSNGNYKDADISMIEVVNQLKDIKGSIKKLENEKKSLESKLTIYLEDHEGLLCDEKVLATYKSNSRGSRTLRLMEVSL